jgi:spore coat protein U-like protein
MVQVSILIIYKGSTYTQILGDSTGNTNYITDTVSINSSSPSTRNCPVYGRIPVQPLTKPMTCSDNMICGVLYNN